MEWRPLYTDMTRPEEVEETPMALPREIESHQLIDTNSEERERTRDLEICCYSFADIFYN